VASIRHSDELMPLRAELSRASGRPRGGGWIGINVGGIKRGLPFSEDIVVDEERNRTAQMVAENSQVVVAEQCGGPAIDAHGFPQVSFLPISHIMSS
jgi:hypothetical protein